MLTMRVFQYFFTFDFEIFTPVAIRNTIHSCLYLPNIYIYPSIGR